MTIEQLEKRVRHDLDILNYGRENVVLPVIHPEGHVYDVVVVGAGQSGLAVGFALLAERITNILLVDANRAGFEGPWETYARMRTLRTPKRLTSIDRGIPSLTFRSWWEAQHGEDSWDELERISRPDWMRYLRWFRSVIEMPIRNDMHLSLIEPLAGKIYRLHFKDGSTILARKVVLATGIQGGGDWYVPPFMLALPRSLYSHTADDIDFASLRGKRIAILGGGASAFDNASAASDAGAEAVHVYVRRDQLPRINPIPLMDRTGLLNRFGGLDDVARYIMTTIFLRHGQPPTNDMYQRAAAAPGFKLHLGAACNAVEEWNGKIRLSAGNGSAEYDFIILATGLISDPRLRPELSLVADDIKLWRDHEIDVGDYRNEIIDNHPYLSPAFHFVAKDEQDKQKTDALSGIFPFNFSSFVNFGLASSGLVALQNGVQRLVAGIGSQFLSEDRDALLDQFVNYSDEEFTLDPDAKASEDVSA